MNAVLSHPWNILYGLCNGVCARMRLYHTPTHEYTQTGDHTHMCSRLRYNVQWYIHTHMQTVYCSLYNSLINVLHGIKADTFWPNHKENMKHKEQRYNRQTDELQSKWHASSRIPSRIFLV